MARNTLPTLQISATIIPAMDDAERKYDTNDYSRQVSYQFTGLITPGMDITAIVEAMLGPAITYLANDSDIFRPTIANYPEPTPDNNDGA